MPASQRCILQSILPPGHILCRNCMKLLQHNGTFAKLDATVNQLLFPRASFWFVLHVWKLACLPIPVTIDVVQFNQSMTCSYMLQRYSSCSLKTPVLLGLANGTSDEGSKPLPYFWIIQAMCTTAGITTFAQEMYGGLWICVSHTAAGIANKLHGSLSSKSPWDSPNTLVRHRRWISFEFHVPWIRWSHSWYRYEWTSYRYNYV